MVGLSNVFQNEVTSSLVMFSTKIDCGGFCTGFILDTQELGKQFERLRASCREMHMNKINRPRTVS